MTKDFRKIQPTTYAIESVKLLEPEHFTLDNGTPVFALNTGSQDLVKIDLLFNAGTFYQTKPLVANLTNKCLTEGTRSFSSKQIAATVDYYGAFLQNSAHYDDARISLYCLNKHLNKLLPVFSEVALQPIFHDGEVKTIVEKSKQKFLVDMEKVKFVASINFNELIYGKNHPYSAHVGAEDYDKIDSAAMQKFYHSFYAQKPFKIILSGKLPFDIKLQINTFFGQHTIENNNFSIEIPDVNQSNQKENHIQKEDALQSAIKIGKVLFNKQHPDFIKMQVVSTVLGGYFGSRLMTNIREDKGYTYGIGSMVSSMLHSGIFSISSEVGNDVREAAIEETFKEIEKLRTELVPEEELNLVKNYLQGSFLRNADGPFALSELVKAAVDYDFKMDYYDHFLETIKNITAKEIRDLAVTYLDPQSMVSLIVGK